MKHKTTLTAKVTDHATAPFFYLINPLNAELNPISYLLALL
jgi:hypothetical protein